MVKKHSQKFANWYQIALQGMVEKIWLQSIRFVDLFLPWDNFYGQACNQDFAKRRA